MVNKLTIRLTDSVSTQLNNIACQTGVCKTDLIRVSIFEYLKRCNNGKSY